MENLIKSIDLNGYSIAIHQDIDPLAPDYWGNKDCFLVYDHRQFTVQVKGFDPDEIFDHIQQTKRWFYQGYWVFPVYAYIHSGVALSLGRNSYPFTCQWDTSFKGFALVKRQKGWTYTRKQALKVAESIVSEWNTYLSGDVYGFIITDSEGEETDSCWGFYGLDLCEDEARAVVAVCIANAFRKRLTDLKTYIRNRVPLDKRMNLLAN